MFDLNRVLEKETILLLQISNYYFIKLENPIVVNLKFLKKSDAIEIY